VRQLPNCPYVFPSDPDQKARREDAVLAWAWRDFVDDPEHRSDWMPRLPMVKSAFQVMRAVQEFIAEKEIADIQGWVVTGASKRGWTTAMVAATNCETCAAKILAVVPMVPIVPNIIHDVH
jgi:PhoPQ-activated pathogenicity-related protein